jgi:hypothetical protein
MEFKQFNNYMHQPDAAYWQAALTTIPRKNLEKAIYDFSFANGVLSGLEIVQAGSPNLTVIVKAGRGVYRDPVTRKAKVIEVHADFTLDLSTHIPSTATTIKIVASPSLNTTVEAAITVNNALITHPDYDAGFTPYNFDPLERDDALIEVDSTPTAPQIVLGEVILSNGQTQILNSHINMATRELGGYGIAISNIVLVSSQQADQITAINTTIKALGEADTAFDGRVTELENKFDGIKDLKFDDGLLTFADTAGGVTTHTSSSLILGQEYKGRVVLISVSAINIIFQTANVELRLNMPGLASPVVLAAHNLSGASPTDQQTTLSGSTVQLIPIGGVTLGQSLTLTLVAVSGLLDTAQEVKTRVTVYTID